MTTYDISKDLVIDGTTLTGGDLLQFSTLTTVPVTLTITGTGPALAAFHIMGNNVPNTVIFNTGGTSLADVFLGFLEEGSTVIVNGTTGNENLGSGPNPARSIGVEFRGLGGNDTMTGAVFGDRLLGGGGDDVMIVNLINGLRVFGGAGMDVIQGNFQSTAIRPITMDLSDGGGGRAVVNGIRISETEAFQGTLSQFADVLTGGIGRDEVNGWRGNDSLDGGDGTDVLRGGDGNDTILGGAGRDILIGESGADVLTGGLGADRFVFAGGDAVFGAQRDQVTDFEQGRDKIDLIRMAGIPGSAGYDPFTFIGETLFLPGFGTQVGFEVVGATTVIQFYDDERLMGEVVLQGVFDLKVTDFIL